MLHLFLGYDTDTERSPEEVGKLLNISAEDAFNQLVAVYYKFSPLEQLRIYLNLRLKANGQVARYTHMGRYDNEEWAKVIKRYYPNWDGDFSAELNFYKDKNKYEK